MVVGRRTFATSAEFTAAGSGGPSFTAAGTEEPRQSPGDSQSFDHEYGHEQQDSHVGGDLDMILERVQEAALPHVKQHGWTDAALVAGARDADVSPAIVGSLENGAADFVEFFVRRGNSALAQRAAAEAASLTDLPMQQRLHTLLRWRLEMLQPYIDSWPQALGLLASPAVVPTSLQLLNDLADEVWHAAGDRSADLTWYAKRAGLAGVYSATELYMLTDYSAEFSDTWSYLDRRIADMLEAGRAMGIQA